MNVATGPAPTNGFMAIFVPWIQTPNIDAAPNPALGSDLRTCELGHMTACQGKEA